MSEPLPLAAAAVRLRGKPGRPRKEVAGDPVHAQAWDLVDRARLMTIPVTAVYMGGISEWTVRDLIAAGVLPTVEIPLPGGKTLRRKLVDRIDIDRLIERSKERA